MKTNHVRTKGHRTLISVCVLVVVILVIVVISFSYSKLKSIWLEQSEICDMSQQVKIVAGKMVKADVIAEIMGLKKGRNLATIDFAAKRLDALARIPNLRDIRIERSLPDKVTIYAEEREPIVRINHRGRRTDTGKVADAEGVVFICQRGTRSLPIIREANAPGTAAGKRISDRGMAALAVVKTLGEPGFSDMSILEIDISKRDYLTLTMGGTYSIVKLAWEDMDSRTPSSHANLMLQLTNLSKAMRSRIGEDAIIWNATDCSKPGRIYADTKGKLR